MTEPTISVEHWDEFQHYKERNAPWIKLYRDILTSESWVMGTDSSRLVQIAIMLLALRYQNQIPHNFSLIRRVACLDFSDEILTNSLQHLLTTKFVKIQGLSKRVIASRSQNASAVLVPCYQDAIPEREGEGEGEREGERDEIPTESLSGKPDFVMQVFEHWKGTWNHPRAALDVKRRVVINRALKGYPAEALCQAITGYQNSPHHTGQNDRQTVYDDIGLLLRDSAHIDAGLRFLEQKNPLSSNLATHNVAVLQAWKPPEIRDETVRPAAISVNNGESS